MQKETPVLPYLLHKLNQKNIKVNNSKKDHYNQSCNYHNDDDNWNKDEHKTK